jgi:transcriptional regulator with XRE-family HTH domain
MINKPSAIGVKVGHRIYEARRKRNLTQEVVAFKVGISASYFGQIERGGRGLTVENLVKIAQAMKVDSSELLRGV